MTDIPIVFTIAGSDSGGGAGIQADLKTMHAFGVYGASAITALTAQNTLGVHGVHTVPPPFVRAQIDAVLSDLRPAAVKTGMLGTREIVGVVAAAIAEARLGNYVFDPVMVATSGDRLLDADAEAALRDELLPLATLITPNLDEAAILVGHPVRTESQMRAAAAALVDAGAAAALVKGGHLEGDTVVDVLYDGVAHARWQRPRIATRAGHGTGCTLSAAIAACLALGEPLPKAVERALDYVHRALRSAPGLGAGHGPLNHHEPAHPAAGPAAALRPDPAALAATRPPG